jgi:uncharacterized cupin superfamily protein
MKIVRSAEAEWKSGISHGPFEQRRKELGGVKFSSGLWELPPGKKSFPLHKHHGTEEALYVVSGKAKVRTTEGETAIGPGDFVSFPVSDLAHQILNDGTEPLVYLAIGVPVGLDVVEYPDSGKVACSIGSGPDRKRFVFKGDKQVDYWDGEG